MHQIWGFFLTIVDLSLIVAHAGTQPTPVPHWLALLVGVVGLWIVIGGGVVVMDKILALFPEQ